MIEKPPPSDHSIAKELLRELFECCLAGDFLRRDSVLGRKIAAYLDPISTGIDGQV